MKDIIRVRFSLKYFRYFYYRRCFPSRNRSSSFPFFQSLSLHSNASKWSFELECLVGSCSKRFDINTIALKQKSFIGESWSHSFISLVVSSIYLLLAEPMVKEEDFCYTVVCFVFCNKTILVYEFHHGYMVFWTSVIPSSLFALSS